MLSGLFTKKEKKVVEWRRLEDTATLEEIDHLSFEKPVLLFKHSTRCSISSMTLNRFEKSSNEEASFEKYFLDLIAHRDVSNAIESKYDVIHQSPQAILISRGKAIYDESHTGIVFGEIEQIAKSVK